MSPLLVKRVAAQLNEVLRQYELRFGPLDLTLSPVSRRAFATSQPGKPSPPAPTYLPDKGRPLFDLVMGLDVRTALERSFKVCTGRLLENRFLMAVGRKGGDGPVDEKVREVCSHLKMPANFARTFNRLLPYANHIYFGFEEEEDTPVSKVYLEFRDKAEERIKADVTPLTPFLLHLGFKWEGSDSRRKAMTRYKWYPSLPVRDILARLPSMLGRRPGQDSLAVAEAIIGLAAERIDSRDIQYVEAWEKGNPRKSFDINMYKANVSLLELQPFLTRLAEYYDLDSHEFRLFCERIGSKRFGHLAGGTDREGRNFMMESDFMDENARPGSVIGPKSVPRFTRRLLETGEISGEGAHRIHVETPSRTYGVEIHFP